MWKKGSFALGAIQLVGGMVDGFLRLDPLGGWKRTEDKTGSSGDDDDSDEGEEVTEVCVCLPLPLPLPTRLATPNRPPVSQVQQMSAVRAPVPARGREN